MGDNWDSGYCDGTDHCKVPDTTVFGSNKKGMLEKCSVVFLNLIVGGSVTICMVSYACYNNNSDLSSLKVSKE